MSLRIISMGDLSLPFELFFSMHFICLLLNKRSSVCLNKLPYTCILFIAAFLVSSALWAESADDRLMVFLAHLNEIQSVVHVCMSVHSQF